MKTEVKEEHMENRKLLSEYTHGNLINRKETNMKNALLMIDKR